MWFSTRSTAVLLLTAALSQPVWSNPMPQITQGNVVEITDADGDIISTSSIRRAGAAAAAATAATTPAPVANALGPAPVIVYTYTTIDAAGDTLVVTDTFTPTYQPTVYPTSYVTGTVLPYSVWNSLYGPKSASNSTSSGSKSGSNRRAAFEGASTAVISGAATLVGIMAGIGAVALL